MNLRLLSLITLVVVAALFRVLPHPPNVVPIMAMALFAGAYLPDRRLALLVPLMAMLLSDLILGFHAQMWSVYLSLALVVGLGTLLRSRKGITALATVTLTGSSLFFLVTNFGVWLLDGLYPLTAAGLWACYIAAIPFFQYSLLGDIAFVALFFGGWYWIERSVPALREQSV